MRKIVLSILSVIIFFSFVSAAGMRVKEEKNSSHSSMRSKDDDGKKKSSMRPKMGKLKWHFKKGDVNPTVSFYDISDGNRTILSSVKIKGEMDITTDCTPGNEICYGGDFELVGKNFVAGCGMNCSELDRLDRSWRSGSCAVCENSTVVKEIKVRQSRREIKMSWHFNKGDVNPEISFYNASEGKKRISGSYKLKGETDIRITCMEDDLICFGGDFELAGKQFTIGCGDNCSFLNSLSGSDRNEACQPCKETSVNRSVNMKKK